MPRVVPSQVVSVINGIFPWAATQKDEQTSRISLPFTESGKASAVLTLVEQVPQELIVLDEADYARLQVGMGALKDAVEQWRQRGGAYELTAVGPYSHLNPVSLIRGALAKCPDQFPSQTTMQLPFINDADLRESLRLDISSAERSFTSGDWKAATVVAGSVSEALLLWALQERPQQKVQDAISSGIIKPQAGTTLESWGLNEYVKLAEHIGVIRKETAAAVNLAKDFRNLIHPGRAQRLRQKCDRGTARSALAAVDLIVRDLTP